jgi:hypothetical protein
MTNELDVLVERIKLKKAEFDAKDKEYKKKFNEALEVADEISNLARGMSTECDDLTQEIYDHFVTVPWGSETYKTQQNEYENFLDKNGIESYYYYGTWLPSQYQC